MEKTEEKSGDTKGSCDTPTETSNEQAEPKLERNAEFKLESNDNAESILDSNANSESKLESNANSESKLVSNDKLKSENNANVESKLESNAESKSKSNDVPKSNSNAYAKFKAKLESNAENKGTTDFAICPYHTHSVTMHKATVELNLSKQIKCIFEPLVVPSHLTHLNLSNNKLLEVPNCILKLQHIVKIDLSNNCIKYFDETPAFVDKVQELSLAKNSLLAPPLWVWKETPRHLKSVDLSENSNMVSKLKEHGKNIYFDCWLNIYRINMINCRLHTCTDILYTLLEVKELILGGGDYTVLRLNELYEFPVDYIKECYNINILSLKNCKIYSIHRNINYYNRIRYLDLSVNYLTMLPDEIGELINLEILILTSNKLESLPDSIMNLKRLRILLLANNRIEYIPEKLFSLPELQCVDLYDNCLSTIPEGYERLEEVDFAQNYVGEPEQSEYIEQRTILRWHHPTYYQKRNIPKVKPPDSVYSDGESGSDNQDLDDVIQEPEEIIVAQGFEYVPEEDWVVDEDNEASAVQDEEEGGYDIFQLFN